MLLSDVQHSSFATIIYPTTHSSFKRLSITKSIQITSLDLNSKFMIPIAKIREDCSQ